MALFLIERNFAKKLEVSKDSADAIKLINRDVGVNWLFSFLSADKKKTYCLYEGPSAEAMREAARRASVPRKFERRLRLKRTQDGAEGLGY